MLLIDGKIYESQELPTIYFGRNRPLSYVLNPKAACTLALNFVFYVNHNYRYFDHFRIHGSELALLKLRGPELDAQALSIYYRLSPKSFTIVRDPLQRFVSAFLGKIFTDDDPDYYLPRDYLTSVYDIDLSPEADPAQSCLAFAKWLAMQPDPRQFDRHFKPQYLNLMVDSRFTVDTILRLEDRDALLAFFTRWIGAEKAKWFLSFRFNEQTKYKSDEVITDELEDIVRKIYARDYELFYPRLRSRAATQARATG